MLFLILLRAPLFLQAISTACVHHFLRRLEGFVVCDVLTSKRRCAEVDDVAKAPQSSTLCQILRYQIRAAKQVKRFRTSLVSGCVVAHCVAEPDTVLNQCPL